jgi:hypothetical protein
MKQAKMQWLQCQNKSSLGNLNKVSSEVGRHFRNKIKEYLNAEIDGLEPMSKIKNIRAFYRPSVTLRMCTGSELI